MHISVEQTDPSMMGAKPHFCLAAGQFVGLRFEGNAVVAQEMFCPWCGGAVPQPEGNHNYPRGVRPDKYEGPRCPHGYPDLPCIDLAEIDEQVHYDVFYARAIREFGAAELARRYGVAPCVAAWIRPCPRCREGRAVESAGILRFELGQIARALAAEDSEARRRLHDLRDDLRKLNEAFAELDHMVSRAAPQAQRRGFAYLIGHGRAVKIGWSDKHPATSGGRLSQLQIASFEPLSLMGLVEGPFSLERQLHRRFATHRLGGEWFAPHEDILAYFQEHGLPV